MQKLTRENLLGILLFFMSMILLGVCVFLCFCNDIWYDELFTMGLANQSLSDLISMTARDVHPPLYYLFVKLSLIASGAFGGSVNQVVVAKLVSVLPFFMCLIYGVTVVRKNFGWLTAGLFSFLLITMPNVAGYIVEVRMYGFALLFVTGAMLHSYLLLKKNGNGNWIALAAFSLAACYTHYFACVAACMVFLSLLVGLLREGRWKHSRKAFLLSTLFCVAGYLPWLLTVVTSQVGNVSQNYWIQPLSIRTLGGCIKFLLKPAFRNEMANILLTVLLFLSFGAFVLLAMKCYLQTQGKERERAGFAIGCIGVLMGLVCFGFVVSFVIRPIFVYRYMLPAVGVFWLGLSILVTSMRCKKYLQMAFLLVLIAVGLRNFRAFYGDEMWKRVNMKQTEEALAAIEPEATLLCNFNQMQAVISYYMPNQSYLWYGQPEKLIREMFPQNKALVEDFSDEAGILQLKSIVSREKEVYFLGSGNAREEIIGKWIEAGIRAEEKADVLLERYWFKVYKLIDDTDEKR